MLPAYLLDAERALYELGPGAHACPCLKRASQLYVADSQLQCITGGVAAAGALSDGLPPAGGVATTQLEEFFRRAAVVPQEQAAEQVLPVTPPATGNQFAAVLSAEGDALALPGDVSSAVAVTGGGASALAVVVKTPARPNMSFEDDAAREMMDAYTASGRAHVNPVTGAPVVWGDTWMHHRGGGIGTGRDTRLRRRPAVDALVPGSPDKRALLAFYDECNGPRWGLARNWGVGEPCGSMWHGVRCVGGRVVELSLNLNNVGCIGGLNLAHLANVSELVTLDLSDNHMSGTLPGAQMHLVPKLQSLVLSGNDFTGSLPPELSALAQLRHLDISASSLSGPLPASLGTMKRLEVLYLGEHGVGQQRNALTGPLPPAWRGMEALSLAGNPVGGALPPWLASLPQLQELNLRDARLDGTLPSWLGECGSLRVLDLAGNDLGGTIPVALASATSLVDVDLSRNALDGHIPAELSALTALRALRLAHNSLEGALPASLAALPALVELDVSHNDLGGTLPRQLSHAPQLRVLRASGNRLGGPFPGWVLSAPRLSRLHVDGNRFNGSLGDGVDWTAARGLVELHASGNSLSGSIPPGLGALPKLASLYLAHNRLTGTLPQELGQVSQLVRLDVSHNALTGGIPAAFGALLELAELHVSHNRLEGALPEALGALPLLRSLQAAACGLGSPLPPWLGTAPSLEVADVSGNGFTGALPPDWYDPAHGRLHLLPLRRSFVEREQRHLNVGANPLFCPLPGWSHLVSATCAWVRLTAASQLDGGRLRLRWSEPDLGGVPGLGCVFAVPGHKGLWVLAAEADGHGVTCAVPEGAASTVKLGHNGTAISQFGQPAVQARRDGGEL